MSKIILLCLLGGILVQCQVFGNWHGDSCCPTDQILVSGKGSAYGQPDIALLRVSFQVVEPTSEMAVSGLSVKTQGLVLVLMSNGYDDSDFQTSSISVYPQYSYINGQSIITGYNAQQSFTITVENLDADGNLVATLIDQLAAIDGIQINSIDFDIFDKTGLQTEAREKAFADAKQKATDYADFANVPVGHVISIVDGQFDEAPPVQFKAEAFSVAAGSSTQVPVGQLEVSYRIEVKFSMRVIY